MTDLPATAADDPAARAVIDEFHLLWYEKREAWRDTTWLGTPLKQCPLDLWVYQELITAGPVEVFVEVGVRRGGLTKYIANVFDLLHPGDVEAGRVVGLDIGMRSAEKNIGWHPRVTLIEGSSTDPAVVEQVRALCSGRRTMILLDSDHAEAHVRAELDLYGPVVTPGLHLIINDTNVNGHPAYAEHGPGPYEAVADFLATTAEYEVDPACEKHMLTQNPRGYLRRREAVT